LAAAGAPCGSGCISNNSELVITDMIRSVQCQIATRRSGLGWRRSRLRHRAGRQAKEDITMRKFVYPLVAALCLYANYPGCLAQTKQEVSAAETHYKTFIKWYPTLKKNLSGYLKMAKENKPEFKRSLDQYKQVKTTANEQINDNATTVLDLQDNYKIVLNIANKDIQQIHSLGNELKTKSRI
jgi:hypothetical protein